MQTEDLVGVDHDKRSVSGLSVRGGSTPPSEDWIVHRIPNDRLKERITESSSGHRTFSGCLNSPLQRHHQSTSNSDLMGTSITMRDMSGESACRRRSREHGTDSCMGSESVHMDEFKESVRAANRQNSIGRRSNKAKDLTVHWGGVGIMVVLGGELNHSDDSQVFIRDHSVNDLGASSQLGDCS